MNRLFSLIHLVLAASLFAQNSSSFEFRHVAGDRWHITSTVEEEVLIDNEPYSRVEILNKIVVEVREGRGGDGLLWNRYNIAERAAGSLVYNWSAEYETEYSRDRFGNVSGIDRDSPVPAVRNVPVCPETMLKAGDRWNGEGTEVFNLQPSFGLPVLLEIGFPVQYIFEGRDILDGKTLERIRINYEYVWNINPADEMGQNMLASDFFPLEVSGVFKQILWWDSELGRSYAVDGDFTYSFFMNDGQTFLFRGTSTGKAVYPDPLDKEELAREIENLTKDLDDVRATATDEGVRVSLENIHFVPDQPVMLAGEEEKLRRIAGVLNRYPDRDILVEGHTARVDSGSDGQVLSEQRARTVARYFIEAGVRDPDQMVIRGMGSRQPVASNATEAGRRRNRRVEIVILEN